MQSNGLFASDFAKSCSRRNIFRNKHIDCALIRNHKMWFLSPESTLKFFFVWFENILFMSEVILQSIKSKNKQNLNIKSQKSK